MNEGMSEAAELLSELTNKTCEAISDIRNEFKTLKADQVQQRKERENLELKLGRMSLSSGGGFGASGDLAQEYKALGAFIAKGDTSELLEMKAMSVGSDPNGGYLVLPALSDAMATKIYDQSSIKRLARNVTIPNGDSWEEIVDNDEPDAEWVGELQSRSETDTPTVGKHVVTLHEIHASPKVTQKILDTSQHDVGAWLEGKVADKFGRTEGTAFVSGNGVAKPFGLLSGTPVTTSDATRAWGTLQYFASGAASTLATTNPADALRNMVWGLRAPYRNGAVWVMNSNTANAIDKIKNGTGDYIWRDGMTVGAPPVLLGHEVHFDENMPDIGANEYPISFGNFKLGYVVVELSGLRVLRDPFTVKPHVLFYTYKRVGGDISNSEAIKLLKIATA